MLLGTLCSSCSNINSFKLLFKIYLMLFANLTVTLVLLLLIYPFTVCIPRHQWLSRYRCLTGGASVVLFAAIADLSQSGDCGGFWYVCKVSTAVRQTLNKLFVGLGHKKCKPLFYNIWQILGWARCLGADLWCRSLSDSCYFQATEREQRGDLSPKESSWQVLECMVVLNTLDDQLVMN